MQLDRALDYIRGRHNGVLVTLKRDGRPQLSNITYLATNGTIRVSVTASRAKARNAARDPRVALHVTSEDFWSYVVVEGDAHLTPPAMSPDDDTVEALIDLYRGVQGEHPDWDDYRAVMVRESRMVLTIHPVNAYGMA